MEITECPTALERDLNPPNTSQCPLLPHSLWDRPLYFSFSRKFASRLVSLSFVACRGFPPLFVCVCACVPTRLHRQEWMCSSEVCMAGFSHLALISDCYRLHTQLAVLEGFVCSLRQTVQPQRIIPPRQTSNKPCKFSVAVLVQETTA